MKRLQRRGMGVGGLPHHSAAGVALSATSFLPTAWRADWKAALNVLAPLP